jgi:hypothetical protein
MPKGLKGTSEDNKSILEYALGHLEREAEAIRAKINHVLRQLGVGPKAAAAPAAAAAPVADEPAASAAGGRKKRVLSAGARARIALAQKKRWAAHRRAKAGKA